MTAIAPAIVGDDDSTDQGHHDHGHPTDAAYWKIGTILAALTAVEVSTYWWDDWGIAHTVTYPLLMVMMVVKFGMVAAFFMHLKFDNALLRRVFVAGIFLAVGVYLAGTGALRIFDHNGNSVVLDPPRDQPIPPPPTDPPPVVKPGTAH